MNEPNPSNATRFQIELRGRKFWTKWIWIALGILVALYIAYLASDIWLPLLIAFLIAMVLDPVVDRLERRGWTRFWAAAFIFASFLIVVGAVLAFAVPVLVHQGETLMGQLHQYVPSTQPKAIDASLEKHHVDPSARLLIEQAVTQLAAMAHRSGQWVYNNGLHLVSNLIWIVIIPIVAFYALKDFHLILAKTLLLVPEKRRDMIQTLVADVSVIFAKYMRGLMTVAALNGLATWLLLLCLRVPNAFMLGFIAGLLYSVPYLGALVTIVLVAAVSFVSGGATFMLVVVGANVLLHQVVFDQIISPRILGGHVGLHPILAIIALLVGNALLGIVGMVLAVPVAASVQVAILALVPKLRQEIDLSTIHSPTEGASTAELGDTAADTKDQHAAIDATSELHQGVREAVQQVEAAVDQERQAQEQENEASVEPKDPDDSSPSVQVIQIQPVAGTTQPERKS